MTTALVDDLDVCVADAIRALATVEDRDWHVPATDSAWTCWEAIEHVADDLFAYAGQVLAPGPSPEDYVPFVWSASRPGGPDVTISAQPDKGNAGLMRVLGTCGAMLSTAARSASSDHRAFHPYGVSDPPGFATMGSVETWVHMYDVSAPLGFAWSPPTDAVRRALDRLFPDVPTDEDPWQTLLWATGRTPLGDLARRDNWRWDSSVG